MFLCNYLPVSIQLVGFPRDRCGVWGGPLYLWGLAIGWDVMSFHLSSCWFGTMLSEII